MNIKDIRRENLRKLAEKIGGVNALAKFLDKKQAQISHLISINPKKNIGDKLAKEIEVAFDKPHGWLDKLHHKVTTTSDAINTLTMQTDIKLNWLPLLEWGQLSEWARSSKKAEQFSYHNIPTVLKCETETFAVRIEPNQFRLSPHVENAKETILVLEKNSDPNHHDLVLSYSKDKKVGLHRVNKNSDVMKLMSLDNDNSIELSDKISVVAVVKQIIISAN